MGSSYENLHQRKLPAIRYSWSRQEASTIESARAQSMLTYWITPCLHAQDSVIDVITAPP